MSIFFTRKPKKVVKKRSKKSTRLEWEKDTKTQEQMTNIAIALGMDHVRHERVFCYRTNGSKARAYARIWSFPKIFQDVLDIEAAYVLEIISEKFDRLNHEDRIKVIIHELLHIPRNFSGSLLPHKYGHTRIDREVESLFEKYKKTTNLK